MPGMMKKKAQKKVSPRLQVKKTARKPVVVAVSGGFDPIHVGHLRMFQKAKALGDKLVVILNNDNWLLAKKGYVFMPEDERKELIEGIGIVDKVILTGHAEKDTDTSVCNELKKLKPHIFANGGDRKLGNIPEVPVCEEIGTEMIFNIGYGGKVQSSSWLVAHAIPEAPCVCGSGAKFKECHGSKK